VNAGSGARSGLTWLAAYAAGLGAVYLGMRLGQSGDASLMAVTFVAAVLLMAFERLAPQRADWGARDGQFLNDVGHLVFGFGLGAFGGAALAQYAFRAPIADVWPSDWPMVVQVALALVVAEFFIYWQHRAVHTVPALWHLHVLHHSTDRMTFLKTTRIHALDLGSSTFLSLAPLLAFGASPAVVLWVTAFGNLAAITQHSNVRIHTPPWLDRVFGTPAVHWLHHSPDVHVGNTNYGMNLMLWDRLFGTYTAPGERRNETFGVAAGPAPDDFVSQVLLPLRTLRDLTRRG
jgi:sterol desaturase/sphingolipid hydroxylase (fatty acid hydroxylase superfamily)